jgi:pimeloyl-ACP methyl ester carboxylesterase
MLRFAWRATLVTALLVGAFYAWGQSRLARPTELAMQSMQSTPAVEVGQGRYLTFRPVARRPELGVIFYPGANSDPRGYAPTLSRIAAAGFLVVDVPMPFDFAIFAPIRADSVRAAYPEVERWVIMGHSMGGAMAGLYASWRTEELAGVVIWDSYPPESGSLADKGLPVWHIHRATPDGDAPEKFRAKASLFPADATWVPIPGGNHMNFGAFQGGGYVEQWAASIPQAEQHDRVVAATVAALQSMAGSP